MPFTQTLPNSFNYMGPHNTEHHVLNVTLKKDNEIDLVSFGASHSLYSEASPFYFSKRAFQTKTISGRTV
jgi:hypothetical protein